MFSQVLFWAPKMHVHLLYIHFISSTLLVKQSCLKISDSCPLRSLWWKECEFMQGRRCANCSFRLSWRTHWSFQRKAATGRLLLHQVCYSLKRAYLQRCQGLGSQGQIACAWEETVKFVILHRICCTDRFMREGYKQNQTLPNTKTASFANLS